MGHSLQLLTLSPGDKPVYAGQLLPDPILVAVAETPGAGAGPRREQEKEQDGRQRQRPRRHPDSKKTD